ncbi:MAG: SufD family Fe-S cluster assembly protein [Candidatus Micrarchaeota archaeon]
MLADPVKIRLGEKPTLRISRDRGEPGWLAGMRALAFAKFKALPVESSETFKKYADVGGIGWEKLRIPAEETDNVLHGPLAEIAGDGGIDLLQINGKTVRLGNRITGRGVVFEDWKTAMDKHPELAHAALKGVRAEGKFAALGLALHTGGVLVHVPDAAKTREPMRVVSISTRENAISSELNVVSVGSGGKAAVSFEQYSAGKGRSVALRFTYAKAGEGARLAVSEVQALGGNDAAIGGRHAEVRRDAVFSSSGGHFGGSTAISTADATLEGDGAAAEDVCIAFGNGTQRLSITSNLFHAAANTVGSVHSKGVFAENSRGQFKGNIEIAAGAHGSSSYLAGHSILLGSGSSADSMPSLKIGNNDVKATHSASVSHIDGDKLFYLATRGLGRKQAENIAVCGFLEQLVARASQPRHRNMLRGFIAAKIAGSGIEHAWKHGETDDERNQAMNAGSGMFEGHYKYR